MSAVVEPSPGASAAVARRHAPERVGSGQERPITVDQTNRSVVVDEAVIVKWLVPPVPAPHPGLELLDHLRSVGFAEMPAYYGAEIVDGTVVAVVSEYQSGALDGWDWFVDELTAFVDGTVSAATVLSSAAAVGQLAARLHAALATPSPVLPHPTTTVELDAERPRAISLLAEALQVATGEAGDVLATGAASIRAVLDEWPSGAPTPAIRLHGDLHIGQLLRSGRRLVVTDFDGNPLLDATDRHRPRPPAVDVASLVQSVDHAARVAQRRRPEGVDQLDGLAAAAMAATLAAYRSQLDDLHRAELLDERLLWPLRVTQELHELVYAARHLPRWAYAPTATLRSMFCIGRSLHRG